MADELGAVRRTPRPTGDRQTPETASPESAGTTNTASLVPGDQDAVSSRVSSQTLAIYRSPRSDALAIQREDGEFTCVERHPDGGWRGTGLIEVVPDDWILARYQPGPECDMEAYAALPDCQACGGTGKDDHATPFEQPLAVHFAGPDVEIGGRRRQLCMWCGHVLVDIQLHRFRAEGVLPPAWPVGTLVRTEDGFTAGREYIDGDPLPPGCCALPDDEPELCGKHVAGTSSNRCLLRAGHTEDCSDEFESAPAPSPWGCPNTPPCDHPAMAHDVSGDPEDPQPMCCSDGCRCGQPPEPARAYLDDAEHDDIWPRSCTFVHDGQRCTFAPGHHELWHRLPDGTEVNNEGEPMADEAQETCAVTDWPAEPVDAVEAARRHGVDLYEETAGYHPNTGEPHDPVVRGG